MRKNLKTRIGAVLLCAVMLTGQVQYPVTIYAKNHSTSYGDGLCEHHTEHDEDCGYAEGSPCTHIHTDECYVMVETCSHVHISSCYADSDDEDEDTATSSNAKGREPIECSHVCSEEEGCVTKKLDCHHEHDETCGYVEGSPCSYVCEICQEDGELTDATPSDATSSNAVLSGGAAGTVSGNAIQKSESTEKIITAWNWAGSADELEIQKDEETGAWGLGLPGVTIDNQADFATVVSMLPTAITATVTDSETGEEKSEELSLNWNCDTYVQDESGNWSINGSYTFQAELPDGYALADTAEEITVIIELGGASAYADTGGFTVTGGTYGRDYIYADKKLTILTTRHLTITTNGIPVDDMIRVSAGGAHFTLNNVVINSDSLSFDSYGSIYFSGSGGTITLIGINKLQDTSTQPSGWGTIITNNSLSLDGTGSLQVSWISDAYNFSGTLNVDGCTLVVVEDFYNIGEKDRHYKNCTVNGVSYDSNGNECWKVDVTAGAHMRLASGSGSATQYVTNGSAMTPIVYQAEANYYFPTDYASLGTTNGVTVTRTDSTTITVSGTPTATMNTTLAAAVAKITQSAPSTPTATITNNSITIGKQTSSVGTTTQYACMSGNAVPAEGNWKTTNEFTGLNAATQYTCYVRFAGNDSYQASEAASEVFTTNMDNVPYMDATVSADGQVIMSEKTVNNCIVLRQQTTLTSGWYVVNSEVTFDTKNRPTVTGDVHLILADGGKLTVPGGITVNNQPDSLTIYGQSGDTGTLIAGEETTTWRSGIGGGDGQGGGNITINGGKVTAIGGTYGAGIGSGYMHNNFNTTTAVITINGGEVTASVKPVTNLIPPNVTYYEVEAAGIGGGNRGSSGIITINGGTVNATGGRRAAAIGSGRYGNVDTITINGGTITANTSGGNGVSIGRGNTENAPTGGTIFISSSATITLKDLANQSTLYDKIETLSGVVYTDTIGVFNGTELIADLTVPAGYTLTVPKSSTLAIPSGKTLTNNGTIANSGTITKAGTLTNHGTISYPVTLEKGDGITGFETSTNGTDYVTPASTLTADYGTGLYVKAILADNRVFGQWGDGSTSAVYQISADNYNPVSLTAASTSVISYIITIPSSVTAGGEEVSIKASNLNLGTGGAVHVKANYGTGYDIDVAGLLTLKREDATNDTITSQMYLGENAFTDLTKDVAVFTENSHDDVAVKFAAPSNAGTIPAGDYSGAVIFQFTYEQQ